MGKLVECVPNFSEGRNREIIDSITSEIEGVDGVELLDVDPGAATNRTVVTFVGSPEAAVEAAFLAIKRASELIDMSQHHGAHGRMGATDVCPFVPVSDMTMEECVGLSKELAQRVGEELGIPVYLYEKTATAPDRESLASIRKGEYEGLAAKLEDPHWKPDFGPTEFLPRTGATVIGAREFLIAYNINLNTKNKKLAHQIALRIRETGRAKRDDDGKIVRDESGKAIKLPGTLKAVRGVGWYIDEYGCAQISMNLLNYGITPVHVVFDEVCRQADSFGLRVTGSELVGLIPRQAILEAGKYYLKKQGNTMAVPEKELVNMAIMSLGLSELVPFKPEEKIIEYLIKPKEKQLTDLVLTEFADEVSIDSPAPGGGSVAALAGGLGAALISMVGGLTTGKKGYEDRFDEMEDLGLKAQALKDALLFDIDEDTRAFNKVMAAGRGKAKTSEAKAEKAARVEKANKIATRVPLSVVEKSARIMELAELMVERGNPNSVSDAGVGGLMAAAGAEGAYLNVLINLPGISDSDWVQEIRGRADGLIQKVREDAARLNQKVAERLENDL